MKDFHKRYYFLLILLFLLIYAIIVVRNAWIGDDAFITFRTIDNFINGYGLTFNVVERVQAYTHPLWMMFLAIPYAIIGEIYFTALAISIILALAAVAIYAFKIAKSTIAACLGLIILSLSDAFIDYSTSGLENPLSFIILAMFLVVWFKNDLNHRVLLYLTLLAAAAALTRMDSILFYLPSLGYAFWKLRGRRAALMFLIGFAPFLLWEILSLFYYGMLFPNSAYAKLGTGLGGAVLIPQGFKYIINSIRIDPLTIPVILSGIVIPFIARDKKAILISLGLILMQIYIVRIGGCFMSGRLFATPLLAAVMLVSRYSPPAPKITYGVLLLMVIVLGLATPYSPVYTKTGDANDLNQAFLRNNIVDERAFYHLTTGLLNYDCDTGPWPNNYRANQGRDMRLLDTDYFFIGMGQIGIMGYYSGPKVYISDEFGLVDPLLARLPVRSDRIYKPGHYKRDLPPGYYNTIERGANYIIGRDLALYYANLEYITRGRLFSTRRLQKIVEFNLGFYDHYMEAYLTPHLIRVDLPYLSVPQPEGTLWCGVHNLIFNEPGVEINLGRPYRAGRLEISRDHNDDLLIQYFNGTRKVGEQILPCKILDSEGLAVSTVDIPDQARQAGYDRIRIGPIEGDGRYSIGHVHLLEYPDN